MFDVHLHLLLLSGAYHRAESVWDKYTGSVGTHLSRREEVGNHSRVGCFIDIGIWEDDKWALTAKLHGNTLHILDCLACDFAACTDLTGEADLGDTAMSHEGGSHGNTIAIDNVEDTRRHTSLNVDLSECLSMQRRNLTGLIHHTIARC
ncbi:hypothetical protein HG530_010302 [Fusarium avenaceum]|nr:hypothetical protein HG530_010302 [Fusarium avenaceum]